MWIVVYRPNGADREQRSTPFPSLSSTSSGFRRYGWVKNRGRAGLPQTVVMPLPPS
jgi:hypothetical protein